MRKIASLLRFGVAATLALAAHAQAVEPAQADASFMQDAAQAGNAEIAASQLAQRKATRSDTRRFAERMIAEHMRMADALKQLAASKQVDLPTEASPLQKAKLTVIGAGDATKFDARYVRAFGIDAHEDAVSLFLQASRDARDPDVRSFALKTLPTLRHHLEMAQRLIAATTVSSAH